MIYRVGTKVVSPSGTLQNGEKILVSPGSDVWLVKVVLPMSEVFRKPGEQELESIVLDFEQGGHLEIHDNAKCLTKVVAQYHGSRIKKGSVTRIKLGSLGGGISRNEVIKQPLYLGDVAHWFDMSTMPKPGVFAPVNMNQIPASARHGLRFYEEYDGEASCQEVNRPIFEDEAYEDILKCKELSKFASANLLNNKAFLTNVFVKHRKVGFFSIKKSKPDFWVSHDDYGKNGYCFRDAPYMKCGGVDSLIRIMQIADKKLSDQIKL
jgi:hypothetical protein